MKRIVLMAFAFIFLAVWTVGCSKAVNDTIDFGSTGSNAEAEYSQLQYSILQDDEIPEDILEVVQDEKAMEGYKIIPAGDDQYVIITLGERNTGGYSIDVLDAGAKQGRIAIQYAERKPAPDEMVLMALTYPYVVIKVASQLPIDVEKVGIDEEEQIDEAEAGEVVTDREMVNDGSSGSLEYQPVEYEIVTTDALPQAVDHIITANREIGGIETYKHDDNTQYLFIGLGERRTGGYFIEILEVADLEDGRVTVRYREVEPGDEMVLQAITYPYEILMIYSELPIEVIRDANRINSYIDGIEEG